MDKAQASNTAIWDALTNEVFIDICVEEVVAKNRPLQCLNNKGYHNLMTKFKERTNREYSHKQLKNHWDSLKRDYSSWKTLKLHASGLGIDPKTGSIKASDEWWAEQIKVRNLYCPCMCMRVQLFRLCNGYFHFVNCRPCHIVASSRKHPCSTRTVLI